MDLWQSKIENKKKVLETDIDRKHISFKMVVTTGKHYRIILETKGVKSLDFVCLEYQEGELTSFKAIRKVHKINIHKKKE